MAEQKKRPPLEKVMTPEGVARFPWLNKPDTKFNADGDYSVGVLLSEADAQPTIDKLNIAADKALADAKAELTEKVKTEKGEKKAKAAKALAEIGKQDIPARAEYDEDGNETGNVILTFKMKATRKDKEGNTVKQAPKLFDAGGDPLPANVAVWGGSVVQVAGSINTYYIPGTNLAGASLRLAAVQVIKLSSGSSGTADSYGFAKKDGYRTDSTTDDADTDKPADTDDGDDF